MVSYIESGGVFRGGRVDPEQLMEASKQVFRERLGIDVKLSEPSQDCIRAMEILRSEGISQFIPFGTPNITIKEQDDLPPSWVKPNWWFFRQVAIGRLDEEAITLKAGWYLFDTCRKPDLQGGQKQYEDDYLSSTMQRLREEGKIYTFRNLPEDSRLGASPNEIRGIIIPEFLKTISSGEIPQPRLMRAIENNVLGNMNPELGLGETDTWEWFEDERKGSIGPLTLIGGSSKRGGLSHIDFGWPEHRHEDAGFRLVIAFPAKS